LEDLLDALETIMGWIREKVEKIHEGIAMQISKYRLLEIASHGFKSLEDASLQLWRWMSKS
jgi:hypothetical protein